MTVDRPTRERIQDKIRTLYPESVELYDELERLQTAAVQWTLDRQQQIRSRQAAVDAGDLASVSQCDRELGLLNLRRGRIQTELSTLAHRQRLMSEQYRALARETRVIAKEEHAAPNEACSDQE